MHDRGKTLSGLRPKPVLVLGTDDIASAVGHALAGDGVPVLLVRDPDVPVLQGPEAMLNATSTTATGPGP